MKGTLAAGAALGVLLAGAVPALALTGAADDPAPSATGPAKAGSSGWQPGDGAPPWSNGRHGDKAHHGAAMREWAHCLGTADKPTDDTAGADPDGDHRPEWKKACGPKPTPPGHLKHTRR